MLTNAERRGIRREAEDILDGCEGERLTEAQQAKFDSLMEQLRSDDLQRDLASAKSISADPNPKGQKQYRSHERIADSYSGADDLSLDRMIRGLATGYWDGPKQNGGRCRKAPQPPADIGSRTSGRVSLTRPDLNPLQFRPVRQPLPWIQRP